MSTGPKFIITFLSLLLSHVHFVGAEELAPQHPANKGPSISIPASQIKFGPTGVKSSGLELKAGPVYGNLQTGKHGTFVKMPAGFSSAVHTHTEDYFAVVLKGVG